MALTELVSSKRWAKALWIGAVETDLVEFKAEPFRLCRPYWPLRDWLARGGGRQERTWRPPTKAQPVGHVAS